MPQTNAVGYMIINSDTPDLYHQEYGLAAQIAFRVRDSLLTTVNSLEAALDHLAVYKVIHVYYLNPEIEESLRERLRQLNEGSDREFLVTQVNNFEEIQEFQTENREGKVGEGE